MYVKEGSWLAYISHPDCFLIRENLWSATERGNTVREPKKGGGCIFVYNIPSHTLPLYILMLGCS